MNNVIKFPSKSGSRGPGGQWKRILRAFRGSNEEFGFFQILFIIAGIILAFMVGATEKGWSQVGTTLVAMVLYVTILGYIGALIDRAIRYVRRRFF